MLKHHSFCGRYGTYRAFEKAYNETYPQYRCIFATNQTIIMTLEEYIEAEIIPGYRAFDAAHREDHVRNVIAQSQELAKSYDVNPKMLYAAAAYHDTGLSEGRERHHLVSGKIIRDDKMLHNWFSDDEIEIIAEAAEDHRASNANPPRSIYGRIIAESDRLIDPDTVIRRTVLYGFDHYPEMNRRQMWERTLSHLEEKYGEGGYLKLWIPESPNAERLAELRRLIEMAYKCHCAEAGHHRSWAA